MAARQPPPRGSDIRQLNEAAINADLLNIEQARMPELRQEADVGNKDLLSMSLNEKVGKSKLSPVHSY
jgi:hypothetical protein